MQRAESWAEVEVGMYLASSRTARGGMAEQKECKEELEVKSGKQQAHVSRDAFTST